MLGLPGCPASKTITERRSCVNHKRRKRSNRSRLCQWCFGKVSGTPTR